MPVEPIPAVGMDPVEVMKRLAIIEADLANIENPWAECVDKLERAEEEWKTRLTMCRLVQEGDATVQEKADRALRAAREVDDGALHDTVVDLRAAVAKGKTRADILSKRASNLQSMLKAMTMESRLPSQQPAWSGGGN